MTASASTFKTVVKEENPVWVRWMVAVTVSLAALLEVIDSSIVNVALPQIQGNLGCTLSEAGWVVTGYSVANAIIIPLTAWLSDFFGKRTYFILSMIGFTIASMLCGVAPNLGVLIASRILQGLFGGALLAKAQAILFETFPPNEQGAAQALFGVGVMIGPVVGPTLGGYLTDTLTWRWIFFVNLPIGIIATLMSIAFLPRSNDKKSSSIDVFGILMLIGAIGSIQVVLEEGQRDDWFESTFISTLVCTGIISLIVFIWHELRTKHPAVDLRVLRHKSLAAGVCYSLVLGITLYGSTFAIPVFAQTVLGYTSMQTGLLMLPGAVSSTCMMPLLARFNGKTDARILIGTGAILSFSAMVLFSTLNPSTSADSMFYPLILRGAGSILMYLPLSLAAFGSLPKEEITSASGFFNLMRQLGGSIGIAGITTFVDVRQKFHRSILVEHVTDFDPMTHQYVSTFTHMMQSHTGLSANLSRFPAMGIIDGLVNAQSAVLSFADCFYVAAGMFVISLPLLFFLGKGTKGGSAASEASAH